MPLGLFHYQVLYNVLENIHYVHQEDELAKTVMENVSAALSAEAGSIFKLMPDGQTLYPLAAYGASIETLRKAPFSVGRGVVGWVAQYAQPVKVDKPASDSRFMGMIDQTTGFVTRSILAAPIISKGRCIGVIEFMNRKGGPFATPDLELISMIGREVGIAFESCRLFQSLEANNAFQEAVFGSLSAGILVADAGGRLTKMNASARRILRLEFDESAPPRRVDEALAAYPELCEVLAQAAASDVPLLRRETEAAIAGRPARIGYSGVPINDKRQARLGTALLFQDITGYVPTAPPAPAARAAAS